MFVLLLMVCILRGDGNDAAIYTTDNAASASIVAAVAATYVINLAKVVRFVLVVAVAIISCLIAK